MRTIVALVVSLLALAVPAQNTVLQSLPTPSGRLDVVCEAVEIRLEDSRGRPMADKSAFAYSVDDGSDRPVMFYWNGGPGGSTALLHTGFGAPLIADSGVDGDGELRVNDLTLIDLADLVYVDPVGTGFSRAAGRYEGRDFWGVVPDAEVAAAFVERYLSERGLLDRPVYLCGESYGGVRVAAMLEPLSMRGIDVEGLLMISPALESATITRVRDRGAGRADRLATFAALAVHEGVRRVEDPVSFIDAAVEFAIDVYLPAIQSRDRLDEPTLELVRRTRDLFAGDPSSAGLDMHDARFVAEGGALGGVDTDRLGLALRTLLAGVHGLETGGGYTLMNRGANRAWRAPDGESPLFSAGFGVAPLIARACESGRAPRVFLAGGWYDLVTPFTTNRRLAAARAFGSCDVEVRDYPAGHVIYADRIAHEAFAADVRRWLARR